MAVKQEEYKSVIGVTDVYIAEVTQDDSTAYVAGTPEYLAPVMTLALKPITSSETQYADDQAFDVVSAEAETDMELTITNLPLEMRAKLLGLPFDAVAGRVYDDADARAPYFALGFRSKKRSGNYLYVWFQKVKFVAPEESANTRADKDTPQPVKLTAKAIKTVYKWNLGTRTNSIKRVLGDQDIDAFDETGWFAQVQVPSIVAPAALVLSNSVPADAAPAQAVGVNVVLTFNNALNEQAVNNVALVKADGAAVAAAVTIDATRKIVTINPTADLDAGSTYIAVYAVVDIYGQNLSGAIDFATA
jgi:phi13 family phage major tail protein